MQWSVGRVITGSDFSAALSQMLDRNLAALKPIIIGPSLTQEQATAGEASVIRTPDAYPRSLLVSWFSIIHCFMLGSFMTRVSNLDWAPARMSERILLRTSGSEAFLAL